MRYLVRFMFILITSSLCDTKHSEFFIFVTYRYKAIIKSSASKFCLYDYHWRFITKPVNGIIVRLVSAQSTTIKLKLVALLNTPDGSNNQSKSPLALVVRNYIKLQPCLYITSSLA